MKFLAKELLRIAAELDNGSLVEDLELTMPEPRSELNASERRRLNEAAKEIASNLGDGTSVIEKAIEYMREGYGDEYYDYAGLVAFFQEADDAIGFDFLRDLGLDDAAEDLEKVVNEVIPFTEDESDEKLVIAAEFYIVSVFGKACRKYMKSAIDEVTDEAWDAFPEAIENLANAFFENEVVDLKKMVGIGFDEGYAKIFRRIKPAVEAEWKKYYNESGESSGSLLKYLYDVGLGARAFSKSLFTLNAVLKTKLSQIWETASQMA